MKSKLLLNTYDGSLTACTIRPQSDDTQVEFSVRYYRYENGEEQSVSAILRFFQVASVDMEINFFDNPIGAELGGFYEILDEDFKKQMLEKVFQNRKDGYLFHGDYDYDPEETGDILNFRSPIEGVLGELEQYRLFQQQTQGGIYHILCKRYELIEG